MIVLTEGIRGREPELETSALEFAELVFWERRGVGGRCEDVVGGRFAPDVGAGGSGEIEGTDLGG